MRTKYIDVTNFGKKSTILVLDDDANMKEIMKRIVSEQKQMLLIDNRKPTSDELFKTSSFRLKKYRQFFSSENLKKEVELAI